MERLGVSLMSRSPGGAIRNPAVEALDVLVGEWTLTLTDAWFLESRDVRHTGAPPLDGSATPSHDPRPASRLFDMTFTEEEWILHRKDLDFHQRFVSRVSADRIDGHWDGSEDCGETWRKDFDLIFERNIP